jgi:hypothetical protein
MALEIRSRLGPYAVTAKIGEGDMDFRSRHIDSRTPAAFI